MIKSMVMLAALVAMMTVPALAEDVAKQKGKRAQRARTASAQMLKRLAEIGLTDEQTAKIKELGKATQAEIKKVREQAGLTPEVMKKRREAMAAMKESDKKGKARIAAINESAGLSEAQVKAVAQTAALTKKLKTDVVALLTAEQKEKLPKGFQGRGAKKAEKANKKKSADNN